VIGTKQRIRYMRQRARPIERCTDPLVVAAREALRAAVYRPDEPEHEYHPVICELLYEAERRADDPSGIWATSMDVRAEWVALVRLLLKNLNPKEGENDEPNRAA